MAVITISRQYYSKGDEIAFQVCERLEYHCFDKKVMTRLASDVGLSESEIMDFSEDNYKVRGFLDRLFRRGAHLTTTVGVWKVDATGARVREEEVKTLDEAHSISCIQGTIRAAYKRGNVVIVGRGGQAILKGMPGVLHVRIEAPMEVRIQYLCDQQKVNPTTAQEMIFKSDRAAADYLKRFYDIDWDDPLLYDLVINTNKLGTDAAAHLIINAVSNLSPN